jgi:hypothetical protein
MNNPAGITPAGSFCHDCKTFEGLIRTCVHTKYNLKAFDLLNYQSIIMELCIQHRMDEVKENRLE